MEHAFADTMASEIANSGLDVEELREFLFGSKSKIEELRTKFEIVHNDPVLKFRPHFYDLTRSEVFENNLKRVNRIRELANEGKIQAIDMKNYGEMGAGLNTLYPTSVHHSMFESIVQILGSEEQVEKYWGDIRAYKIIGCYAQTEMGTGSNVRGLETTATYDKATEEFVIDSPTVSSTKCWPGDLGKMANHAVLFAQLIIDGVNYGVNGFFIRIRDDDYHRPLEGIEIGDIGPKYGYFAKDNGYMRLNNIRVPRSALLSRYINVTTDGNIEIKGDPRVGYATMLWIRVSLLIFGWQYMLMSCCVATRYCLKRSQFKTIPGSVKERLTINYQSTQSILTRYLAFGYANAFMSHYVMKLHDQMHVDIKDNKFGLMNNIHVFVSSLKAHYMQYSLEGMIELRELLGGHGFLMAGLIPSFIGDWSANVTLEGDGMVMYQQTARKLIKLAIKAQGSKKYSTEFYPYFEDLFKDKTSVSDADHVNDASTLIHVLKLSIVLTLGK